MTQQSSWGENHKKKRTSRLGWVVPLVLLFYFALFKNNPPPPPKKRDTFPSQKKNIRVFFFQYKILKSPHLQN